MTHDSAGRAAGAGLGPTRLGVQTGETEAAFCRDCYREGLGPFLSPHNRAKGRPRARGSHKDLVVCVCTRWGQEPNELLGPPRRGAGATQPRSDGSRHAPGFPGFQLQVVYLHAACPCGCASLGAGATALDLEIKNLNVGSA